MRIKGRSRKKGLRIKNEKTHVSCQKKSGGSDGKENVKKTCIL